MNFAWRDGSTWIVGLPRFAPPGTFTVGQRLRVYDHDGPDGIECDDMVAEGVVFLDEKSGYLCLLPDDGIHHLSDLRDQPEHWSASVDWDAEHPWRSRGGTVRQA